MLRSFGGKPASSASSAGAKPAVSAADRLAMMEAFEETDAGWFWATDAEHKLTYLSPSVLRRLSPGRKVIGSPLSELISVVAETAGGSPERPLPFLLGARNRFSDLTAQVDGADGEMFWVMTGVPQTAADGSFIGFRGGARDITADFQTLRDNSRMSQYDSLTGLANRHRMAKRLEAVLVAYRAAKRSCALLLLDLDRFKQVNDTLGHPAGDELLKQVAQRLERIIPSNAELGRLGGDEFELIVPDMDDRGKLAELTQRIIQMISQPYSIDGVRAIIGCSVGIAIAPYDGIEPDELVKAADLALYAAKGCGRGQYRFYSNDLKDSAHERREIEEDLSDAIARDELELNYQPVVRTSDQMVVGFEALIRWNHPAKGYISPEVFIPIAEETNQILALGEWVLRRACQDAAQWPGELRVAVNVSATQFSAETLPKTVRHALEAAGLPPRRLELEITESVFMGDAFAVDSMFSRLKKLGVRLALDDFGTGYSSLGYLRRAPFDKIKIDQSFVRGATESDNSNAAIITAIVSLAGALNMDTTAEGVEALDELALVTKLGAATVQGFVFSTGVSQASVLAKLGEGDFRYEAIGPGRHRPERRSVFRTIGVIHEDHRYDVLMRNLSRTGALIEGLYDVPVGTELVIDLGEGQLVVATVRRSHDASQGVQFESALISDGADGLCTRHRVSPYALAAAGMPLRALGPGNYEVPVRPGAAPSRPKFLQVATGPAPSRAA